MSDGVQLFLTYKGSYGLLDTCGMCGLQICFAGQDCFTYHGIEKCSCLGQVTLTVTSQMTNVSLTVNCSLLKIGILMVQCFELISLWLILDNYVDSQNKNNFSGESPKH